MKALRLYGAGLLAALLLTLAACGGGCSNTITVRQLDAAPLVGAYYRTGAAPGKP